MEEVSEKPRDCFAQSCEPHKTRCYYIFSVVLQLREKQLCCFCYMGHVKTASLPVGICYHMSYSFLSLQWNSVMEEWTLSFLGSEQDR